MSKDSDNNNLEKYSSQDFGFDAELLEWLELNQADMLNLSLDELLWDTISLEGFTHNFDLIQQLELRARLREMKLRMLAPVISLKRLKKSRIASISILFGLCSCQSSYIFDAFFGASASRIHSL